MRTRNIPVAQWRETLDDLSRAFDGMRVSLEIIGGNLGAQDEVRDQPLRGITFDPTGVTVQIEKRGGIHLDHHIRTPQQVRIVETNEGAVMAVEIEESGGMYSLVRFRSPFRPDVLNRACE